jgi:hypothetical protein
MKPNKQPASHLAVVRTLRRFVMFNDVPVREVQASVGSTGTVLVDGARAVQAARSARTGACSYGAVLGNAWILVSAS